MSSHFESLEWTRSTNDPDIRGLSKLCDLCLGSPRLTRPRNSAPPADQAPAISRSPPPWREPRLVGDYVRALCLPQH
jgi:hypothetical protein